MTADHICMIGVNEMSETRSIKVIVRLKPGGFSQSCQAEIRHAGASIVLAMLATIQLETYYCWTVYTMCRYKEWDTGDRDESAGLGYIEVIQETIKIT
jgi:hypothetical protein